MAVRRGARPAALATATALGGLAAVHVLWATGSTFPVRDGDEFTETFLGVDGVGTPGPGACLAVAGALGGTAWVVLTRGADDAHARTATTRLTSLWVRGAAAVLGARALAGLATSGLGLRKTTERFRSLDLSVYSPLCLALAGGLVTVERNASARA